MVKKTVAALVALIMIIALLPAGVISSYADDDDHTLKVGTNTISTESDRYYFTSDESGLYAFITDADVNTSIIVAQGDGSVESTIIMNGNTKRALAVVHALPGYVCVVVINNPAGGECTVMKLNSLQDSCYDIICPGDEPDVVADFDYWGVFTPGASGSYALETDASFYAAVNICKYADGELTQINETKAEGCYTFYAELSQSETYIYNIFGRCSLLKILIHEGSYTGGNGSGNGTSESGIGGDEGGIAPATDFSATVTGHALMLSSGDVGVIFNVRFNDQPNIHPDYMEFFTGKVGKHIVQIWEATQNDDGTYSFICPISAYRMADKITPVLHYSKTSDDEDRTITLQQYSVSDYINYVLGHQYMYEAPVIHAAEALADYGYYSQRYLSQYHGYEVGENGKYEEMLNICGTSYDAETVRAALIDYSGSPFYYNTFNAGQATYSLNLESDISIYVYFKVQSGSNRPFGGYTNTGEELEIKQTGEDTYRIKISGIKASSLGEKITFDVYTEDGSSVFSGSISPYHYIYRVLEDYGDEPGKEDLCNAVCALYYYGEALKNISANA